MTPVADHLCNLIRIPSVSALSNRPVIDYATRILHQATWHTREFTYHDAAGIEKVNLLAAPPGQNIEDPAAELAFMCHTDTVPYAADWPAATAPFIAEDILYGCGACDVKGFLACLLTAIAEADPSRWISGLRLILTADEEVGCIGAKHLMASGAIKPRRVIIGEPTSLHAARAGKGYCLAEVTVLGREAHSAHPHQGTSAIYHAARLITAIEVLGAHLAATTNPFFNPAFTTLNIGTIHGGTAKNIIAGQCTFQLEWRPIPGESPDAVPIAVNKIADDLRAEDPDFHCQINVLRRQSGFETPANSPLLQTMESITRRAAISIPFGSEAPIIAAIAEEVLVFGPGDMRSAHSSRECVPLTELDEAVLCLKTLMTSPLTSPLTAPAS